MNKKEIFIFVVVIAVGILWMLKPTSNGESGFAISPQKTALKPASAASAGLHSDDSEVAGVSSDADHLEAVSGEELKKAEAIAKNFDYKNEIEQIEQWKSQYPKSKQQLLRLITSEDAFKQQSVSVPAHTVFEMTQRQMGALKVLSLKVLLENENSKQILLKDLDHIFKTAADTTLRDIARAAQESVRKDRPFVRDMIEGLSQLQE